MRGRIAAACAAILVGLAPPGALASAWLAEAAWAPVASAQARSARGPLLRREVVAEATAPVPSRPAAHVRACSSTARLPARRAFRSPSGPAPSQAPPAA
jgi:hypothetical protein